MSSEYAEFHDALRSAVRGVLAKAPRRDGASMPSWTVMAKSGWLGLEVPAALGGAGATFAETAVVQQELGRSAAVSAYVGSAVLGVGALGSVGPTAWRDRLLGEVAGGHSKVALALPAGDDDPKGVPFTLESTVAGLRLRGRAPYVVDALEADRILVPARHGGSLVFVDLDPAGPGVTVAPQPVVDITRQLACVSAEGATIAEESVVEFAGSPDGVCQRLRDRAALATACDSLGIAEAMLEATVSYASVRKQFGRPVGSFQAVQHACADMHVQVSLSRELLAGAIAGYATGGPEEWAAVSMAKAHICSVAVGIAGKAMQLHGGIGYTWEGGIHAFLKRAALNRSLFGSPTWHRRRLGQRYLMGAAADPEE